MSAFRRSTRRAGVTASVNIKKVSVQVPVRWVISSMGFTPSPPASPSFSSRAAGIKETTKAAGFSTRRTNWTCVIL